MAEAGSTMTSCTDTHRLQLLKQEIFQAPREGRSDLIESSLQGESPALIKEVLHSRCDVPLSKGTPLILAVKRNHIAVVRLLLEKFRVDVNQEVEHGTTALLFAVRHFRVHMVRLLVSHGADIFHADDQKGTPFHVARAFGKIDVFRYLVGQGALDKLSRAQVGVFLLECFQNGQIDCLRCLLESGANIYFTVRPSKITLLHYAVEDRDPVVVKLLLDYGARLMENIEGQNPLVMAALRKLTVIVDVFVASPNVLKIDKIKGLEILGAQLVTTTDMDQGYSYLCKAMDAVIIRKPCPPPLPGLGNVLESRTMDVLESRKQDEYVLKMECLGILQRHLGDEYSLLFENYWTVLDSTERSGRYHQAITLNHHAMRVYRGSDTVCNLYKSMVLLFGKMLSMGATVLFSDVEETLQLIRDELEITLMKTETHCKHAVGKIRQLYRLSTSLLKLAIQLVRDRNRGEMERVRNVAQLFIDLPREAVMGYSVLHIAVRGCRSHLPAYQSLFEFPDIALLNLLVQCGADVHAVDWGGNTALHVLAMNTLHFASHDTLCKATSILVEAGGHLDARNKKGLTPMDLATEEVKAVYRKYFPLTMKCLATKIISESGIAYGHLVPGLVANYIKLHSA